MTYFYKQDYVYDIHYGKYLKINVFIYSWIYIILPKTSDNHIILNLTTDVIKYDKSSKTNHILTVNPGFKISLLKEFYMFYLYFFSQWMESACSNMIL